MEVEHLVVKKVTDLSNAARDATRKAPYVQTLLIITSEEKLSQISKTTCIVGSGSFYEHMMIV